MKPLRSFTLSILLLTFVMGTLAQSWSVASEIRDESATDWTHMFAPEEELKVDPPVECATKRKNEPFIFPRVPADTKAEISFEKMVKQGRLRNGASLMFIFYDEWEISEAGILQQRNKMQAIMRKALIDISHWGERFLVEDTEFSEFLDRKIKDLREVLRSFCKYYEADNPLSCSPNPNLQKEEEARDFLNALLKLKSGDT